MRLGVLFSGGKDSAYALYKAREKNEIACLISVVSENRASYMFHTPNIDITGLQAEAMGLPLVRETTMGEKEEELDDLKRAIEKARDEHNIKGIVTGAIESVYQSTRVQRICHDLGLWCFNPLWLKDQEELLKELLEHLFMVIISGVFAYPLDEMWLGRELDEKAVEELVDFSRGKYRLSPSGEGGEIETTVLDAPMFEKMIEVREFEKRMEGHTGHYIIKEAGLVER